HSNIGNLFRKKFVLSLPKR
ncbi:Bifunctional NAD biosynthesis protein NadR, partial [Haemophilus influenzae]